MLRHYVENQQNRFNETQFIETFLKLIQSLIQGSEFKSYEKSKNFALRMLLCNTNHIAVYLGKLYFSCWKLFINYLTILR